MQCRKTFLSGSSLQAARLPEAFYGTLGVTQVCRQQLRRLLIFPNSPKETAVLCMCTCFFHRYLIEDFYVLGSFEVYHLNVGWGCAHSVSDKASLIIFFVSVPSFQFNWPVKIFKLSQKWRLLPQHVNHRTEVWANRTNLGVWMGEGIPWLLSYVLFFLFRSVSSCFLVICKLSSWLCIGEFS